MITFHVGRFDSSMTPLAFVVKWRELVETAVPGPAPEPQIRREGDFSFAVGARHARSNGKAVTLSLVTVTGRGRTVGIVGMAAGDEALRELGAFFETVALTPAASAGTTWGPPVSGASGLVGRWWKDAGGSNYFWYEFSDKGFFSYSHHAKISGGPSACRAIRSHLRPPRARRRPAAFLSGARVARSASRSVASRATGLLISPVDS